MTFFFVEKNDLFNNQNDFWYQRNNNKVQGTYQIKESCWGASNFSFYCYTFTFLCDSYIIIAHHPPQTPLHSHHTVTNSTQYHFGYLKPPVSPTNSQTQPLLHHKWHPCIVWWSIAPICISDPNTPIVFRLTHLFHSMYPHSLL